MAAAASLLLLVGMVYAAIRKTSRRYETQELENAGDNEFAGSTHDDDALRGILSKYPSSPLPLAQYASNAELKGDFDEALIRWRTYRRRRPNDPTGYVREAYVLLKLENKAAASKLLASAFKKFPDSWWVSSEWALLPSRHGDWAASLERWQHLSGLHFNQPALALHRRICEKQLRSTSTGMRTQTLIQTSPTHFPP